LTILVKEDDMNKNAVNVIGSTSEDRPLRVKAGFDPTAPDLHLGHMVLLRKLKELQDSGHKIIFLIGDFTAKIGDPTGRSKLRPILTDMEIEKNVGTFKEQVFKILNEDETEIRFNSEWWGSMPVPEMMRILSGNTVAALMQREDFRTRMDKGIPISVAEMVYPLIQGFDSVKLQADIEVGGTDQLFNLFMGREMQEKAGKKPQTVITMPIINGLDGKSKMSKSAGNHIGLNDDPVESFGKIMSISDDEMMEWLPLLTNIREESHPMETKMNMAFDIIRQLFGFKVAIEAKESFKSKFVRNENSGIPIKASGEIWIPEIFKRAGLIPSTSEGKRLINGGALKIDGEKSLSDKITVTKKTHVALGKKRQVDIYP